MKKTLTVLAIGATALTPVLASAADVKVYGRAHVSLDVLDDGKDYQELNLSSNSSRLGFKAETEINENLTAFAQVEQQINFTSGSDDSGSVSFATRDTFAGLKGNFGQVRVGRFDSPFKAARNPINFFGGQVGDIRNLTRVGNLRFDERNANTLEYQTPTFGGGFAVSAAYSLHEGTAAGITSSTTTSTATVTDVNGNPVTIPVSTRTSTSYDDSKKDQAYDLALGYKAGPVDFTLAYEKYEEDASRGERDGFRTAISYKVIPELNLAALYQMLSHDNDTANPDAQVFGVAADYKIMPNTYVRGQYLVRDVDADDANANLIALGLEHRLSKELRVYGNFATVINDANSNLTPWSQARSTNVSGVADENSTGLSLGMRYDF